MPRGGRRVGRAGESYSNRTDLNQPVRSAPMSGARPYGTQVSEQRAQNVVALPSTVQPSAPSRPPSSGAEIPPAGLLRAPTARPNEPVTSGLPIGAGPGPEVLPIGNLDTVSRLRALYSLHPSEPMRQLVERAERELGTL